MLGSRVVSMNLKDASDGATLESALTKTDDTWTLDSDPALPLDQSKAQGVADSMTALTALRELSDDADVASMGFDTPTYELSLKTADTEWTLTVGSKEQGRPRVKFTRVDDMLAALKE